MNRPLKETITDRETLQQQISALINIAPIFEAVLVETGVPELRLNDSGFKSLCKAIVSQQLSVASASSIWKRLCENHLIEEGALLNADDECLRACGLSKQKIRYVKSLAEHAIDYQALEKLSDEAAIETLTAVVGIGHWTAEIYLLFSLNRNDVFAHNDLALQIAAQSLLGLAERPKERTMRDLAKKWSPYRSAAAYLLWAYYGTLKGRDGI